MTKVVYKSLASQPKAARALSSRAAESRAAYQTGPRSFQTAEDIIPIAELKSNMSAIVRGLEERPRPLVITLNGKPAAVVMSTREYDVLTYRARFLEKVARGLADAEAGRTYDGEEVVAELRAELGEVGEVGKKPRKSRGR
jgi:prevent-host-death family protein